MELNSEAQKRLLAISGQSGIETQHTRMLICPRVFYVGEKNNFIARGFTPSGKLQNDKLNQYSQLSIFLPLSR